MAIPVTVRISLDGGQPLTDYHALSIWQELFTHHSFQVVVPYEMLEGQRTDGFFHQAHERYCGKPIVITLAPSGENPPPTLTFKGVVTQLALSNAGDFAHSFVLSGFSTSYLLEDGTQRRTFRQQGLKQIFGTVLGPYAKNLVQYGTLQPEHREKVKYTVQYGESNYAFLSRLADAYGEWFYYDGEQLCLGRPPQDTPLEFQVAGTESFTMAVELSPSRFVLGHYDYLAHKPYEAPSESQALEGLNPFSSFALQQSQTLFAQPARYVANRHVRSQSQLNTAARQWKASHLSGAVLLQGSGENPGFGVGKLMRVHGIGANQQERHDYGTYRLASVSHSVRADMYENAFTALPHAADAPMPNPQVQAPLGAPELAEVIDGADPQHLGRIRVRFHWPVEQKAQAESGWLRVTTPYSGDGKGQLFTPEVGSQVLVNYEQHLAEFPVVVGNLFHPQNPQQAKYTTPNNHLKGLQTAGGNKVVMNDTKGAQTILLSNSNQKTTAITVSFENDGKVHIQSAGPVAVNGSTITLEAGAPGKNQTAYTGAIVMKAKTITMEAEQGIQATSHQENITLEAAKNLAATAKEQLKLEGDKTVLTGKTKQTLTSSQAIDVQAPSLKLNA